MASLDLVYRGDQVQSDANGSIGQDEKPNEVQMEHAPKPREGTALTSAYSDWPRRALIQKFRRMFLLGVLISFAGMYAGYIDSAPGAVVANQGFIQRFGTVKDPKTGKIALNAQYVAVWSVGQKACSLVSQSLAHFAVDYFGRKPCLAAFVVLGAVAVLTEMFAKDWKTWMAAKAVTGIAEGMVASGPLTLMAEITFPQMRGNVLCWFAVTFALGGLFCNSAIEILQETLPNNYLRLIYSEWIFVAMYAIIWYFAPESPAWLIYKGKIDKAKKTFAYIIGNVQDFDLDFEFEVLVQEVQVSRQYVGAQGAAAWREFFKPQHLKRALIPLLAYCGQQIVGGAYIYNYTTYFFQQAGLKNPFIASVVVSLVSLLGIFGSIFLIDRIGRRTLMIWGTFFCLVFNFVIGGLAFLPINDSVGAGLITATACWVLSYGLSYYTIGWAAIVEMSTPLFRAKAAAFAATIQFGEKIVFYYVMPLLLSDQKADWGAKVGLLCGGLSIIWIIPIILFWPETSNRSYAALDDLFERKVQLRKFHKTTTPFDPPEFEEKLTRRRSVWEVLIG